VSKRVSERSELSHRACRDAHHCDREQRAAGSNIVCFVATLLAMTGVCRSRLLRQVEKVIE